MGQKQQEKHSHFDLNASLIIIIIPCIFTRTQSLAPNWLTTALTTGGTRGKIFTSPWLQGPGMTATALIILEAEVGRQQSANSN